MTRDQSKVCARCAAYALGMIVYALNPPSVNYFPLEYAWRPGYVPGLPSVDWYGRLLWALIAVALSLPVWRLVVFRARAESLADAWHDRVSRVVALSLAAMLLAGLWSVLRAFTG